MKTWLSYLLAFALTFQQITPTFAMMAGTSETDADPNNNARPQPRQYKPFEFPNPARQSIEKDPTTGTIFESFDALRDSSASPTAVVLKGDYINEDCFHLLSRNLAHLSIEDAGLDNDTFKALIARARIAGLQTLTLHSVTLKGVKPKTLDSLKDLAKLVSVGLHKVDINDNELKSFLHLPLNALVISECSKIKGVAFEKEDKPSKIKQLTLVSIPLKLWEWERLADNLNTLELHYSTQAAKDSDLATALGSLKNLKELTLIGWKEIALTPLISLTTLTHLSIPDHQDLKGDDFKSLNMKAFPSLQYLWLGSKLTAKIDAYSELDTFTSLPWGEVFNLTLKTIFSDKQIKRTSSGSNLSSPGRGRAGSDASKTDVKGIHLSELTLLKEKLLPKLATLVIEQLEKQPSLLTKAHDTTGVLKAIDGLPIVNLTSLLNAAKWTYIKDDGLQYLPLEIGTLKLHTPYITGHGIAVLNVRLPRLKELSLKEASGLAELKGLKLPSLEILDLEGCEKVSLLQDLLLPNLKTVNLTSTKRLALSSLINLLEGAQSLKTLIHKDCDWAPDTLHTLIAGKDSHVSEDEVKKGTWDKNEVRQVAKHWLKIQGNGPKADQLEQWYQERVKWAQSVDGLKIRATNGDQDAQLQLGEIYELGKDGIPQNLAEAARLYKAAAKANNVKGMYHFAKRLEADNDKEKALRWYHKAFKKGYPEAKHNYWRLVREEDEELKNVKEEKAAIKTAKAELETAYTRTQQELNQAITFKDKWIAMSLKKAQEKSLLIKDFIEFMNIDSTYTRTHLNLSISGIEDKDVRAIAESFTHLTGLNLARSRLGNEEVLAIAQYLTNLTSLNIASDPKCQPRNIDAHAIKQIAGHLTNLRSLELFYNKIGEEGAKALTCLTKLVGLGLHACGIGIEGGVRIAECLINLVSLDASGNELGKGGTKKMVEHFANAACLATLELGANNIEDEGAESIAQYLTKLTSLGIWTNNIRTSGATAIAQRLTNLTRLSVGWNGIGTEGAKSIAQHLTHLKILSIENDTRETGSGIGDNGALAIAEKLTALTVLCLWGSKIGDEGASAISERLISLTTLDLSKNALKDKGAQAIAQGLPHLTNLNLSTNNIRDEGKKALEDLKRSRPSLKLEY